MTATDLCRRSILAVPLAATLLFAACGTSDSTATDTTDTTAATGADGTTDPPATEVVESPDTDTTSTDTSDTVATSAVDTTAAGHDDPEAVADYRRSYSLMVEEFGTMTTVTVEGDTRTIETNALPDHETGEFPNDGNPNTITAQAITYEYPIGPTFVGEATESRTPGVGVNGVKFEPGTAETVSCESGETLRVEALQDVYNLGLDFNNAHVQPTGEYHYHGVSELLADAYATDDDLVHVGFAADGYLMYYSKSGAYTSGYEVSTELRAGSECTGSGALRNVTVEIDGTNPDGTYTSDWVYSDATGDLDECNGVEVDGEYAYIITNEYPFIGRCLNGGFTESGPGGCGPPPDGAPDQG